jgi:aspartate-semialdehyde dehydrogenase
MKKPGYSVAVIGATGLVGAEIISVLAERRFPIADLQLYASLRTAGDEIQCGPLTARVELLEGARFNNTDVVFLAAGEQTSAEWVERAAASGAVVIDTAQLFAADEDVPLVVPEVNAAALAGHTNRGLVVSPDPPAIALAVALNPLRAAVGISRVVVSAFEPVSTAGRAGVEELQQQTLDLMQGRSVEVTRFPHRAAFNLLPQVGEFLAGGAARDEQQTAAALRRLLELPDLAVSVTRVWVPLFYGEALSVNVETVEHLTAPQAQDLLRAAPGVLLQDDAATQLYPTAADAVGQDATLVGRVRDHETLNVLDLWLVIDNIRKGAAVNAVQIAELLIRDYL